MEEWIPTVALISFIARFHCPLHPIINAELPAG